MKQSYLTEYTESIEKLSESFEYIISNSKVNLKAVPKGFYSSGEGIVSENFYVGNNLTKGLISIEIEKSESYILSIPKNGKYTVNCSNEKRKKFSRKRGGIVFPAEYVVYTSETDKVDDLIIIVSKKKLNQVLSRNYNYNIDKYSPSFIDLTTDNEKVNAVISFIESTLKSAKNFQHIRESLLIKSNIEEIAVLYIADLIADALEIPFH